MEGKAASARNASTHGLTAREVVIHPGERPDFDQLLEDLTEELAPEGTLETLTFNNLVHAAWNQRRCHLLESDLAAKGLDPLVDPEAEAESARIGRYSARAERSYYRALCELRALRTNRALRQNEPNDGFEPEDASVPALADIKLLTKRTQSSAPAAPKPRYRDPFFEALNAPPFPERTARIWEEYGAKLAARTQQSNK